MGYASAMAFILAVIIFIFTFLQRRVIETRHRAVLRRKPMADQQPRSSHAC